VLEHPLTTPITHNRFDDIYTKETIAEFKHRTGIIRNFVTVIRELIEYLIGYRFILDYSQLFLAIENNSYG